MEQNDPKTKLLTQAPVLRVTSNPGDKRFLRFILVELHLDQTIFRWKEMPWKSCFDRLGRKGKSNTTESYLPATLNIYGPASWACRRGALPTRAPHLI